MERCSELAKVPVSKTGVRKDLRVRVPPSPNLLQQSLSRY